MPLQATSGAASYDAFGGGVPAVPKYIEDYFSTFLYSGTGAPQTITNGIDLATKGGLVWYKRRSGVSDYGLVDTARGMTSGSSPILASNLTDSQIAINNYVIANTTGFSFGSNATGVNANASGSTYVSWSWAKAPKFFDVVTFTGNGINSRTVSHSLNSVPACVIIKSLSSFGNWAVWHRGNGTTDYSQFNLNTTNVAGNIGGGNYPAFTSTTFQPRYVESTAGNTSNLDGESYVAYLFAHDAGGFGLTGTDNVISCGSFTTDGSSNATITLGYEPQWVLTKRTDGGGGAWGLYDTMRGWSFSAQNYLLPNDSGAEGTINSTNFKPTATGFTIGSPYDSSATYIYIAIRRGPMKVPTSGTSVFGLSARTGTGSSTTVTGSSGVSDTVLIKNRGSAVANLISSRLTGINYLVTSSDAAQVSAGAAILQANPWDVMDGVKIGSTSTITNASANTYINYFFDRAPSFFDTVCYTGDGTGSRNISHNLNVVPELMILRRRNAVRNWFVYSAAINADRLFLNSAAEAGVGDRSGFLPELPTSTQFTVGGDDSNSSNQPFISYLFASCAGVSKVGSYTGTGALQTINCGFTSGARFVLIKRTDSTGNWWTYDSARGITSGNDPYLYLNSTAAEVTGTNYVDTDSTGFKVTAAAPAELNANGGSFIFLAIS